MATFAAFCRLSAYYAAPDAPIEKAIAFIREGKLKEAEATLNQNLSSDLPTPRARYWKGYVQFADKRYGDSVQTLGQYLEQNPTDAQARKLLGLDLFMLQDSVRAQTELERAIELDPKDGEAVYYLGRVYFSRQNLPAALGTFHKLLELEPKSVRGHNHLGQTYEGLNRFEEAEKAYKAAIVIDRAQTKKSEWPYYNLGVLQLSVGRTAEAIQFFNSALEIQPNFPEARLKRAMALSTSGDAERAKLELEDLLRDEPLNADAHYQLGRLYTRLGNSLKAREHLMQFQKLRRP